VWYRRSGNNKRIQVLIARRRSHLVLYLEWEVADVGLLDHYRNDHLRDSPDLLADKDREELLHKEFVASVIKTRA
jgi:hypothetical protein